MVRMSKQRFRLGELDDQPHYFHATFKELTHKTTRNGKKAVILLTDIYLVDESDHKIRLAKSNDFIDSKGRHIVADHCWVTLTKPWFIGTELLSGDEVFFKANVTKYKINRDDVLEKRDQIWQDAEKKSEKIYQRWSKYTDMHRRKNFNLSLQKMKDKQRKIMELAKKQQNELELVDYTLNRISQVKLVKEKPVRKGWFREDWSYDQYKTDDRYSGYLAARSIKYANGEDWLDGIENEVS